MDITQLIGGLHPQQAGQTTRSVQKPRFEHHHTSKIDEMHIWTWGTPHHRRLTLIEERVILGVRLPRQSVVSDPESATIWRSYGHLKDSSENGLNQHHP